MTHNPCPADDCRHDRSVHTSKGCTVAGCGCTIPAWMMAGQVAPATPDPRYGPISSFLAEAPAAEWEFRTEESCAWLRGDEVGWPDDTIVEARTIGDALAAEMTAAQREAYEALPDEYKTPPVPLQWGDLVRCGDWESALVIAIGAWEGHPLQVLLRRRFDDALINAETMWVSPASCVLLARHGCLVEDGHPVDPIDPRFRDVEIRSVSIVSGEGFPGSSVSLSEEDDRPLEPGACIDCDHPWLKHNAPYDCLVEGCACRRYEPPLAVADDRPLEIQLADQAIEACRDLRAAVEALACTPKLAERPETRPCWHGESCSGCGPDCAPSEVSGPSWEETSEDAIHRTEQLIGEYGAAGIRLIIEGLVERGRA